MHASLVQTLLSLQLASVVQLALQVCRFWNWQVPLPVLQLSSVHGLLSLHTTAEPVHLPLAQTSPVVQALPSVQAAVLAVITQPPVLASQASLVHGLLSLHTVILAPWHTPFAQASPQVQAMPSLQVVPVSLVTTHAPVAQTSLVHVLLSLQSMSALHWLPQPAMAAWAQTPVATTHESVVHTLASSQLASEPLHTPKLHKSSTVQALLSLQVPPAGALV